MNKKRLFYDFLQKHNALEAYKRAFKVSIGRSDVRVYEYIPLGASFVWARTPEGHEYWKSLDEKWCRHYDSMKKKYHF
jgi:hypothetical protein